MSFGDEIAGALVELRALAESRMRGTCTILRPGQTTTDAAGDTFTPATVVYTGKFYARYPGLAQEASPDVAGATAVVSRLVVRIPFGTVIRPADVVRVDAEPDNPQLVGTYLRVASIDDQSQATAQRLLVEDIQAGVLPLVIVEEAP